MSANLVRVAAAVLVALVGLVAWGSLFTVQETEQALVLRLGEPRHVVQAPGLHVKAPFIENVEYMEKRILDYDPPHEEVIASDKKRIVVDTYTRYRIRDPLVFYRTVNNEIMARQRLAVIINSSIRRVLATVEIHAVLSERRELMRRINEAVNVEASKIGIDIVDVRIKRTDLPEENSNAIYRRMQAERERDAKEKRAIGAEEMQKITADADRQKQVLLAEARKQAEILRGEGDAERNRIYAEAFQTDPEFFRFYRSMSAYRKAMDANDTTLVLSPDSDFFRYFGNIGGDIGTTAPQ